MVLVDLMTEMMVVVVGGTLVPEAMVVVAMIGGVVSIVGWVVVVASGGCFVGFGPDDPDGNVVGTESTGEGEVVVVGAIVVVEALVGGLRSPVLGGADGGVEDAGVGGAVGAIDEEVGGTGVSATVLVDGPKVETGRVVSVGPPTTRAWVVGGAAMVDEVDDAVTSEIASDGPSNESASACTTGGGWVVTLGGITVVVVGSTSASSIGASATGTGVAAVQANGDTGAARPSVMATAAAPELTMAGTAGAAASSEPMIGAVPSDASGPAARETRPTDALSMARTTTGSNWVPAPAVSSCRATAIGSGFL
jgi:hypothetical protein